MDAPNAPPFFPLSNQFQSKDQFPFNAKQHSTDSWHNAALLFLLYFEEFVRANPNKNTVLERGNKKARRAWQAATINDK